MRAPHVLLAPLLLGPCSAFFGPRVQISVCESALLPAATEAFVDSFWLSKSETGALGEAQRRQLARDQLADFQKRYGGAGAPSERRGARSSRRRRAAGARLRGRRPRPGRGAAAAAARAAWPSAGAQARARRQAVRACEAPRRTRRRRELDLEVEEKNKAARELYAKLGYAVVDRRPEARRSRPSRATSSRPDDLDRHHAAPARRVRRAEPACYRPRRHAGSAARTARIDARRRAWL